MYFRTSFQKSFRLSANGLQLKQIGLARAIVRKPSVLLLDDPLFGVEPKWTERFAETLMQVTKGMATIITVGDEIDLKELQSAQSKICGDFASDEDMYFL